MSLFDEASLIVTPNAFKASKLYSIKPTNGSGDLTVTRATTATYVGSDGLIKTAGVNEVRFDYTNGSCPSILVEPQRTNLALQSEMFSQSPWTNITVLTPNTNIAPDGTLSADTLNDTSTALFRFCSQNITVSANSTVSASVFIRKTTGTPTNYPSIYLVFSGGALRVGACNINTTTGVVTLNSDNSLSTNTNVVSYGDYWRVSLTTTDNLNNTTCQFLLYPAISSDGITNSTTATGSAVFWGAQLEAGSNATSYIPTTASAVTRNADVISKSGLSGITTITETFENGTTNVISGSPTSYAMSQGRIKQVIGV